MDLEAQRIEDDTYEYPTPESNEGVVETSPSKNPQDLLKEVKARLGRLERKDEEIDATLHEAEQNIAAIDRFAA